MSEGAARALPPPDRALSGRAAIIGLGETDYHADYQAARARAPGYAPPTPEGLAELAFTRALADSGLRREEIDGLSVSFIYGGPGAAEMARRLELSPRYLAAAPGIMAGPLQLATAALAAGRAHTIALVYAAASRAAGRQYGGGTYTGSGAPASYYYFHPWGWSSQAAHWALVWQYYRHEFALPEEALGAVAMRLRENAGRNPNAVMQAPLTLQDYLNSRYIVRPLHLFDLCLVNDGAVCLILRRADFCADMKQIPVCIAGWGEAQVRGQKLDMLVRQRLRPVLRAAAGQALAMAGMSLADIQHLEAYDASTIHLVSQVEGLGFAATGTGLEVCAAGALPVNTAGGMLSDSYMHGWNHVAEITRQLRHQAGARQISGAEASMFCLAQTDSAHPIIFRRGA